MRRLLPLLLLFCLSAAPPAPPIVKGVALLDWGHMGDLTALGVPNYYGWGAYCNGAAGCLNMNRNWTLPQATCYPTLLLGNEPTNPEPAGHPITATLAASVTVSIERACPQTRLVVANIHLNNGGPDDLQWLRDYLSAYAVKAGKPFTHTLGVHCYAQYAADCVARLRDLAALPFSGQYWLTEFAMYGDPPYTTGAELAKFLTALPLVLPNRIERAYIWTNRGSWPFDLVSSNGTLTDMGQVYAAWTPPTVRQTWLPLAGPGTAGYP